jgi:hypothetical protein
MSSLVNSTAAALALLVGIAASAHAQQVADLPPAGPRASSLMTVPVQPKALAESPKYIGPAPGATDAAKSAAFQKPAGYDNDVTMHPYNAGVGPKTN